MLRSNGGGHQTRRRYSLERARSPQSILWFSSLLLVLLGLTYSNAFHQRHQMIHQRSLYQKQQDRYGTFRSTLSKRSGKIQIDPLPSLALVSSLGRHKKISNGVGMDRNALFSKVTSNGIENERRFRRFLLRRSLHSVLLLITAALMVPASALASTAVASTAPVMPPVILTCPVSAATEYRLMGRLVFAALIGAALGKERSFAKHSAGVRTMSLVSMGAAVFTVCSGYGFLNFPKVDASRMAANVASGVGFVGAGVITTSMRNQDKKNPNNPQNNVVHGLTTAATIWLSAAVGVACGVGLLRVATTAAFSTIFILRMGRKKKKKKIVVNNYRSERHQQKQQRHRLKLNDSNPTIRNSSGEFDDEDDFSAEIHVTAHWDENHDDHHGHFEASQKASSFSSGSPESKSRSNSDIAKNERVQEIEIKEGKSFPFIENLNSTIINDQFKDPSDLMEEIVRSAWKNDDSNVTALLDLVLNRVEQPEIDSKSDKNSMDDDSSSNSKYLP